MMKTKRQAKRIFSLLMSFAMMLMMLVPTAAFADNEQTSPAESPYTISILPSDNTLTPTGTNSANDALKARFKAYAIFTGELNQKNPGGYTPTTTGNVPGANQLANIEWGNGIKPGANGKEGYADLLKALMAYDKKLEELNIDSSSLSKYKSTVSGTVKGMTDFEPADDTTLGEMFKQALTMAGYVDDTATTGTYVLKDTLSVDDLKKTAAVIAEVISDLTAATKVTPDEGEQKNNADLANAFAEIVANYTHDTTGTTYTYLDPEKGTASTWVVETENDGTKVPAHWEISGLNDAGYYLIIDTYNEKNPNPTTEEDEISKYMLAVFGSQTIKIKSNAATVDKEILTTTDANGNVSTTDDRKGASAGIGDTVTFRLTGTLPENFENYEKFEYIFHDKLSAGLTFNADSVKVYAIGPKPDNKKYEISKETVGDPDGDGYTLTTGTGLTDECSFEINFSNLRKLMGVEQGIENAESKALNMTNGWTIIAEYTATINPNAVVVDPEKDGVWDTDNRNNNNVHLEYSNDVNDENSTGKTTDKTVYVYVYGLNINKVDGTETDETKDALAGAEFALTKDVTKYTITNGTTTKDVTLDELAEILGVNVEDLDLDTLKAYNNAANNFGKDGTAYPNCDNAYTDYYINTSGDKLATKTVTYRAVFTKSESGEYTIVKWLTPDEVTRLTNSVENWKEGDAITLTEEVVGLDAGKYYLSVTTVGEDQQLHIKGIDEGTYTLTEVVTPTGYDTMDAITFTVTPTIEGDDADEIPQGALTKLEGSLLGDDRDDVKFTDEDGLEGYIPVTLKNMPAGYLPGTGGMGTILFYTGGAILLALGALFFLRRKTRRAAI